MKLKDGRKGKDWKVFGFSGVSKLLVRDELLVFMPVVIRHSGILSDSIYKIGKCQFIQ
jgi:hypothetical protein